MGFYFNYAKDTLCIYSDQLGYVLEEFPGFMNNVSYLDVYNVKTAAELLESGTKIDVSGKSEASKGDETRTAEGNARKYELQQDIYSELCDTSKGALLSDNISEEYSSEQPSILL